MQLRSGRVFLDVEHFSYLLVRLLLEDIQIEDRSAPVGQLGHKGHQHLFGNVIPGFDNACLVWNLGKLFFTHHQLTETLLSPQVIDGLGHHHPCHPRAQRTLATKGEVGEDFDEAIVQHVMSRINVARITVAHRQHLLGIEGV